jgi:hypothetical protein
MPYGLLGYPVLQAADILHVKANLVPVGKEIPVPVTPPEEKKSLPLTAAEQEELDRLLPPDEDDLHGAWRQLLAHHLQSKKTPRP